jgi:pimeloyl-ACP methyl ester carboxylesterase
VRVLLVFLIASRVWGATADLEGRKIFYRAAGQGKETLLFIHGWSCNETFFLPQMEEFRKSYRVISLDLPGHGKSDLFPSLSMDLFARAVEAVRLRERGARPVLIGHSLGAAVARQHGRLYPGVAKAFVFLDGSIFQLPPDEAGRERWKQMIDGLAARFSGSLDKAVRERNVSEFLGNLYADDTPREFRVMVLGQVLRTKPETSEGAMRAMAQLELWDELKLEQPALALRAGRQAPPGEEAYLKRLFPNLRYQFRPGVSHFLQLEKPEETNAVLQEFLRSLKP